MFTGMYVVTPEETTRLFKRFLRLDTDKSGGLDQEELMKIQRFSNNPLSKRFLEIFDTDKDGVVNFNEFLEGMSVFATKGSPDKKLYFIFQMYDVNQDGFLSNGDLFNALKMMVGENLDDVCLQVKIYRLWRRPLLLILFLANRRQDDERMR